MRRQREDRRQTRFGEATCEAEFSSAKRRAEEISGTDRTAVADHSGVAESSTAEEKAMLYAACLGELGQFGNQLFQYAFAIAYSSTWGLRLRTPTWIGSFVFEGDYTRGRPLPADGDRVLLADRVVLSHAGWRQWAEGREPLASLRARENAGAPLSGRKLRQWCPQVNAGSIAPSAAEKCCAGGEHVEACLARGGTLELWGFFQFDTFHFAAHRPRLQRELRPIAPIRALVSEALARVRAEAAERHGLKDPRAVTLVCVHVRCKEDVLPIGPAHATYRAAPGGAGADVQWRRRAGVAGAAGAAVEEAAAAVVGTCMQASEEAAAAAATAAAAAAPASSADVGSFGSIGLSSEWRDEGVFWAAPAHWYAE